MAEIPSTTWRMLSSGGASARELPKGLDATWNAALGLADRLVPRRRRYLGRAARIVALEAEYRGLAASRCAGS